MSRSHLHTKARPVRATQDKLSTEAMTSQKTFAFQRFAYHVSVERWKTSTAQNVVGIEFMGARWNGRMYTYNSPIEFSVNWPGSNSYELGQLFTLISMGLIRYSCGHILAATMNRCMSNLVCGRFFIMLYRNMVMKMLKCKQFWRFDAGYVKLRYKLSGMELSRGSYGVDVLLFCCENRLAKIKANV